MDGDKKRQHNIFQEFYIDGITNARQIHERQVKKSMKDNNMYTMNWLLNWQNGGEQYINSWHLSRLTILYRYENL